MKDFFDLGVPKRWVWTASCDSFVLPCAVVLRNILSYWSGNACTTLLMNFCISWTTYSDYEGDSIICLFTTLFELRILNFLFLFLRYMSTNSEMWSRGEGYINRRHKSPENSTRKFPCRVVAWFIHSLHGPVFNYWYIDCFVSPITGWPLLLVFAIAGRSIRVIGATLMSISNAIIPRDLRSFRSVKQLLFLIY